MVGAHLSPCHAARLLAALPHPLAWANLGGVHRVETDPTKFVKSLVTYCSHLRKFISHNELDLDDPNNVFG